MLVHILKHVLDTNLFAIADAPYRIELQAFGDSTLKDEYSRGTRAADEVGSLRIKVRYGQCEDTVMLAVQQSDTVGTDEGSTILLTGVEDALFEDSPLRCLLAKTCRDDDEGTDAFLCTEIVDVVRTILRCHHEDGEVGLWDVLHIVEDGEALYLVFLWVDDTQFALIVAAEQIAHDGTTRLMGVVRAADDDDALRVE